MRNLIRRMSKKAGLPPGTPVHTGERKTDKVNITVFDYDADRFTEQTLDSVEDCLAFKSTATVTWINIDGVHDTETLSRIGRGYDLHLLLIEDVANTMQRPKIEDYDACLFIVLKMLRYGDGDDAQVEAEQVSLVLGRNYVISFQESPGDVFEPIRERIRKAKGRVRRMGADYLAYTLMDAIVDGYYAVLERIAGDIEELEDRLIEQPGPETLADVYDLKTTSVMLRRMIWPLRDVAATLSRDESDLIEDATRIYLRDLNDHTHQVLDTVETFREAVVGMQDLYLSSVSNHMNQVMKTLTIMASIFIPLTFIAGIYGMNFEYIPELKWQWGYFAVWGVMLGIAAAMIFYFRRKRWV
jgi:magnesium transporter